MDLKVGQKYKIDSRFPGYNNKIVTIDQCSNINRIVITSDDDGTSDYCNLDFFKNAIKVPNIGDQVTVKSAAENGFIRGTVLAVNYTKLTMIVSRPEGALLRDAITKGFMLGDNQTLSGKRGSIYRMQDISSVDNKEEPVCISTNIGHRWHLNGKLHREDGPAIECTDGTKEWYINGQRHRVDGPACEYSDGDKYWYKNDQLHRVDGPAIERANGHKEWHLNGQRHRVDGPAVEQSDGTKSWWLNGQRHREDGPAIEYANGTKEWCLNGTFYTQTEFEKEIKKSSNKEMKEGNMENKSLNVSMLDSIKDAVKSDLTKGAQLAAGESASKVFRSSILMMLKSKGAGADHLKMVNEFFNSEYGRAFLEMSLGYFLTFFPMVKDNPTAKYIAVGCREDGARAVGSQLMSDLSQFIAPALMAVLNGQMVEMPDLSEYETTKARIKEQPASAPDPIPDLIEEEEKLVKVKPARKMV